MKLSPQPSAPKGVKYALTVPQSVLFADLSLQGSRSSAFRTVLGIDYEPEYVAIDAGGAMSWNYDTDQSFVKAMMKNRPSVEDAISDYIDGIEATTRLLDRQSRLVASNSRRHRNNSTDVQADLELFWHAYELQSTTLFSYWNMAIMLSGALTDKMREHGLHAEVDDGLARFLKPYQPNYFTLERHELAELSERFATEMKNKSNVDPSLKAAVEHHIDYFGFLLTPYNLGQPPTVEEQLDRLGELTKADSKMSVFSQPELFSDLPADVVRLARLAQKFTFWKTERVDIMALADVRVKPLYEQAAGILGISLTDLVSMTKAEILASLSSNDIAAPKAKLKQRQIAYCLILYRGKIDFYQPTQESNQTESSDNTVLEGVSASVGLVQGKVRLLLDLDEVKSLQAGEVLVTTMTRPEMGVALDRAAAFVTDEGGLLCHAAIISREMKKPCVIATGNASKILKTGDLIEVDGTQGLVRKL